MDQFFNSFPPTHIVLDVDESRNSGELPRLQDDAGEGKEPEWDIEEKFQSELYFVGFLGQKVGVLGRL